MNWLIKKMRLRSSRKVNLLPSPLRKGHSSSMGLVDLVYSPLVSSRISPLSDTRQCRHRLKYIFLDRRRMLYLSSILQLALLLIHLDQEPYKFLHTAHSQYRSEERR